jgi:hypothetical protein
MRTGVKRRLKAYEEIVKKLRICWIACDNKPVPDLINDLVSLNRKFEREDNLNEQK